MVLSSNRACASSPGTSGGGSGAGRIAPPKTLEELRPDLVCLQEVWQEGAHNQAAELAERLGMSHVFALDRTEGGVDQGVALLSRWP